MDTAEALALALRPSYEGELQRFGEFKIDDFGAVVKTFKDMPGGRILDLAGGYGRLARVLARLGHDVTVVEWRKAILERGRYYFAAVLPSQPPSSDVSTGSRVTSPSLSMTCH